MAYVYAYMDPSSPGQYHSSIVSFLFKPLYIGKGSGDRFLHGKHAVESNRPLLTNPRLYDRLKDLLEQGYEPEIVVIDHNLSSHEALDLEEHLVDTFGRLSCDKDGILLNLAKGGGRWDTTGLPPPNKGKKYTDWMSPEMYADVMSTLTKSKRGSEQSKKMAATRKEKGSYTTGEKHPRAKKFIAINPSGVSFELNGNLKTFCAESGLSWQTLYNNRDKGVIVLDRSKYKNLKRLTPEFFNTVGWQLMSAV